MNNLKILLLFLLSQTFSFAQQSENWTLLFNTKNLENWEQKNGSAEYRIDKQEIVGISKMNTRNSFLCTKESYGDFILELEVKIHPLLNSGIQIRSHSIPTYYDGAVHGYQVEVDPSPRAYTGGIYDESRRGWLYPLSQNEAGRKAFRQSQWNKLRIEAIGPSIRVWLNGVNTANIVDDLSLEGFIALQIHSISDQYLEGKEVRWRNLRIKTTNLQKERKEMNSFVFEENFMANSLSQWEKQNGWRLLWDGNTTNGWQGVNKESFPKNGWIIKDGILTIEETEGIESANPGGDILTSESFRNFDLKIEFKITKGANSGIKYFVDPMLSEIAGDGIGLEYQILDDQNHPDANAGVKRNRQLGALYDLIPAENLSRPGVPKGFKGIGQWNQARIKVTDNKIEHWLNGYKIVSYERKTQVFRALLAYSKYAGLKDFAEIDSGPILLQDHGNAVSFRSIKIKVL